MQNKSIEFHLEFKNIFLVSLQSGTSTVIDCKFLHQNARVIEFTKLNKLLKLNNASRRKKEYL